ncbi:penicillin-binding transpeptidase domain-containing protein [Granulicella paludicola]|uniref:penicillin-binding transpeptidase domain-containing protein n=1 Tax=Granulicella paludicola TaxID=474951 RepID=UPI0021E04647|nr:penicillin-binding transpeptidase domain-containing protein [Granulicella paludicola]
MKFGLKVGAALLVGVVAVAGAAAGTARKPVRRAAAHHAEHARPIRGRSVRSAVHESGATRVVRGRVVRGRVVVGRRARYGERFTASSFADDVTFGDVTAGEDPIVRQAAIQALAGMNGTAMAIDPSTGRILAMVNQKLALSAGAEPCSTIKVAVALAALKEGIITADTPVNLGGHYTLDLTHALAKSVNLYFEVLGRAMGFDRVKYYANQFGLGELAGYHIQGEHLGVYPDTELPQASGGVGRMCSFGESISMTPLQLGALVSAIANGGTLYYLQHPTSQAEVSNLQPQVKRQLDIANVIPQILPGMQGAVDFRNGTARSLRTNFAQFPVFGKTGTCSNNGTRFGWFVSYADTPKGRIVTVIFLEGGRPTFGPKAAELTGAFYRAMYEGGYFSPKDSMGGSNGR